MPPAESPLSATVVALPRPPPAAEASSVRALTIAAKLRWPEKKKPKVSSLGSVTWPECRSWEQYGTNKWFHSFVTPGLIAGLLDARKVRSQI